MVVSQSHVVHMYVLTACQVNEVVVAFSANNIGISFRFPSIVKPRIVISWLPELLSLISGFQAAQPAPLTSLIVALESPSRIVLLPIRRVSL